eukprot:6174719-Pleurochrysis_carterae.AAC.3
MHAFSLVCMHAARSRTNDETPDDADGASGGRPHFVASHLNQKGRRDGTQWRNIRSSETVCGGVASRRQGGGACM